MEIPGNGALRAEESAEFFAEDGARDPDGEAEEAHGPDAKCSGEVFAVADHVKKLVDRLGNGEVALALSEDERN